MSKELLITCPLCGRAGFTERGLRAHWCPEKAPQKGFMRSSAPLTKEEWQRAVAAARKKEGK